MSVVTYPAPAATTYPPGVLTGRPMEMFGASPTIDLYATPEQWLSNKDQEIIQELCDSLDDAPASYSAFLDQLMEADAPASYIAFLDQLMEADAQLNPGKEITDALDQFEEDSDYEEFLRMNNIVEVDVEMEEVLDAIDQEKEEEMGWIEQQLQLLEGFQDKTAYYMYPMSLTDSLFSSFGIKEALQQFEEDFDYEESLQMEQLKNTEVNFHRLLATPPSSRSGFCGTSGYNPESRGVYELLNTERYRFEAKVIHDFPYSRQGYALAETVYGKIYIPEKFRGYVGPVGSPIDVTVALQDVSPKANGKTNSFRFSAIYLH